jgi:hypothetical protein
LAFSNKEPGLDWKGIDHTPVRSEDRCRCQLLFDQLHLLLHFRDSFQLPLSFFLGVTVQQAFLFFFESSKLNFQYLDALSEIFDRHAGCGRFLEKSFLTP